MAQPNAMSVNQDDIKTMRDMVKEAINLFAKERARANVACFNEAGVDWQLSLSEVPVTLASQPNIQQCGENDAVFFLRMNEKLEDGRDKLDARVFMAPIMASKTGTREVPYILNTWPAMAPRWQGPVERCSKKDEENLTSYLCWCLDSSSMSQMPGLDEMGDEQATGGAEDTMDAAAAIYASQTNAMNGVRELESDEDD